MGKNLNLKKQKLFLQSTKIMTMSQSLPLNLFTEKHRKIPRNGLILLLLCDQTVLRSQAKECPSVQTVENSHCLHSSSISVYESLWKLGRSQECRTLWMIKSLVLSEFKSCLKLHFINVVTPLINVLMFGIIAVNSNILLGMGAWSCECIETKSSFYFQNLRCREINEEKKYVSKPSF